RRRAPDSESLATLEPTATPFSAGLVILGGVATLALSVQVAGSAFVGVGDEARAAFALAACALTALLAAWSRAARRVRFFSDAPIVAALDWLTAASVALADVAVAVWLHASLGGIAYSLAVVALAEALAAEALRRRSPARVGLRIGVQILAGGLIVIAAILTASQPQAPNAPLMVACAVAVAIGLTFALRGGAFAAFPWGLFAGIFLLLGLNAVYTAAIPSAQILDTGDRLPGALAEYPTLLGYPAVALWALGLALKRAPLGAQVRRLRSPIQVTALIAAVVSSLSLIGGHSRVYGALFLGAYALLALVVSRLERQPLLAGGCGALFGAAGALVFVITNRDGAAVAALPIGLALLTIIVGRWLGRAYTAPIYIATLFATFFGYLQLVSDSNETTAGLAPLALGIGGWMALIVALALLMEALTTPPSPAIWMTTNDGRPLPAWPAAPANPANPAQERRQSSPLWMLAPACATLLTVVDARALAPLVALALGLALLGTLLRQFRGAYWEPAWLGAALVASLVALNHAAQDIDHAPALTLSLALLFALVAYVIAWRERLPWLSLTIAPYALLALAMAGALPGSSDQQLGATFAMALGFTLAGMAARLRLGRAWALAPYVVAVIGAGFTATRVTPYPQAAGLLEALLLIFAALAFVAALLERTPWAALAPAAFAVAAALAQPDGHALLPLALAFAAAAYAVSRTRGSAWSLPLYGATLVTAVVATWQGRNISGGFEVVALVVLALAAWALAAL
ncbi:MAG: hypothetical protein ACHQ1E_14455, partial [Ktedonobacterales bacterium]